VDIIEPCTVDVLIREIVEEVAERSDSKLRLQYLGALRANSGQISDWCGKVDRFQGLWILEGQTYGFSGKVTKSFRKTLQKENLSERKNVI